jgi:CheY-like chemotaxis protein
MSRKVLIIEDNTDIRDNIVELLELEGYQLYSAGNGKTGVELALFNIPDIILCDIMMPEMDGYCVLSRIREYPKLKDVPFIFLSAKAERLDLRKGMDLGADGYLIKPFDDITLLSAIESKFNKHLPE